ncbi:HNH endonuclease [Rhodococcus sp. OK519]|uniref:HNH endonuclease n=1 Tax=Rhodococcus sp. OK519 TaxID=2135729 RepID=UPI000D368E51
MGVVVVGLVGRLRTGTGSWVGRSTGPSRQVAQQVVDRAGGGCEICGVAEAQQIHHRTPRGMGGSRDPAINMPANLIHICAGCHVRVESKRVQAEGNGHLVRRSQGPSEAPILRRGVWVLLDDEGGWMSCPGSS